ncbi:MAG TPA: alkaline phosphatase D family protein [Stellaceae bacterium]|nr:alkaline phosphatase D family protein [Stellaceae bacterium]
MPQILAARRRLGRRAFLAGAAGSLVLPRAFAETPAAPAIVTSEKVRPGLPCGVMSGDVTDSRAVIWSKTDRPARMLVEVAATESFADARRVAGPAALEDSDFTARLDLGGLPPGETLFYRVVFQDLGDLKTLSAPATGRLRTAPLWRQTVTFAFSGDEAGQGWGINPDIGGYRIYEAMRRANPDFFIHSGDQIYADNPIAAEIRTDDGRPWKNLTAPGKAQVAQSLVDYRGNFAYNFLDANKRRFAAEVPFLVQWDDHEVRNNWYPGQILGDERYTKERSASLLAAWARRALFEYNPMRFDVDDPERVYRSFSFGPALEVFMLDERSYRGPNSPNRQSVLDADSAFVGAAQLDWLKRRLLASKATWKLVASDMPISLVVPDLNPDVPKDTFEAWANGDNGPPLGRELELASLFAFIKKNAIKNVVWVTADVHYAAAYRYSPDTAQFTEFSPFWEFVAGPINAGTFGPNEIDRTFGPEEKFLSIPKDMKQNRSPLDGRQYFGLGRIDGATSALTVSLHDIDGAELYKVELPPDA